MDLDTAKLYREYEELSTKLTPIRNEYNFIVTDIEKKKDELDVLTRTIQKEKDALLEEHSKKKKELQLNIDAFEGYKLAFYREKDTENKKLKAEEDKLLVNIDFLKNIEKTYEENIESLSIGLNKINIDIEQQSKKLLSMHANIDNINDEYCKMQDYIKHTSILIKQEKVDAETAKKEACAEIEKYKSIKSDAEEKTKSMQNLMLEMIKEKEGLLKIQGEIDRKTTALIEQESNNKESYESIKNLLHINTEKEMQINKSIYEFQEEKHKFLILMKQKGIKKDDIKQLEKDFTM